jgi:hypothetical protein
LGSVRKALGVALAALALAPAAHAGGPSLFVGAAEDDVRADTLTASKARLDLLQLAGLSAVRVTSIWDPANPAPSPDEILALNNLTQAGSLDGIEVFASVYNFGSKTTPLSEEAQVSFASHAAALAREVPDLQNFIIGNEPNLNRFWLPQFNPDGSDAAAPAYLTLLYRSYQALKAVDPTVRVFGGAISPRGIDRPGTKRDTHSPTAFIQDLGAAYRASGLTTPVMDALAFHPYPENSLTPPTLAHPKSTPIGIADYTKLTDLLGKAFDGTAQPGSTLPILYAEYGVEAQIPAAKASLYTGTEAPTIKPAPEATQALFYSEAITLSFCQPNVIGLMIFHAFDESALDRFQSGLYYADGTPKSSLETVKAAIRDAHGGVIARCNDLELTPKATVVYPKAAAIAAGTAAIKVTCDLDCIVYARVEKLPRHSTTLVARGKGLAGDPAVVPFPARRLAPGRYRFTVRLTVPVNSGPPLMVASRQLVIR